MTKTKAWLLASRPKTLSAAVVPVLIGTAMSTLPVRWLLFACTLLGAMFIQVGTNFVNDALDFRKGADTGERLGPLRVTQAGLISAEGVLRGAYVCFVLAALCGVPLVYRAGWPLMVIGIVSIVAAYAYTGGPYPLAYNGLGELFVLIFFGFVAVGGTYFVQTQTMANDVLLAGFAAGSLAVVLIAINNLRDVAGDRISNKRTMAVRFGESFARAEIAFFALAPFAAIAVIARWRGQRWLFLPLLALPLALALIVRVHRSEGAALNRCLAMAGGLQWLTGILFVAGCLR
ncbi:MAG: menA [Acidobacteria bacterium]|nr:menA [Acidobacteriota bacterium]